MFCLAFKYPTTNKKIAKTFYLFKHCFFIKIEQKKIQKIKGKIDTGCIKGFGLNHCKYVLDHDWVAFDNFEVKSI